MKKLLIALAAVAALSACSKKEDGKTTTMSLPGANGLEFDVVCLDGVQYWVNISDGYSEAFGLMSPKIDKLTLQPTRCQ